MNNELNQCAQKAGDQSYTWAPLSREIRIRSDASGILSFSSVDRHEISPPSPGRSVGTASGFLRDFLRFWDSPPTEHPWGKFLQATTTSLRQRRQHRLLGPKKGLAVGHLAHSFFLKRCHGDFAKKTAACYVTLCNWFCIFFKVCSMH